jgi:predicted negative regulator of RcsB-dependent stress response
MVDYQSDLEQEEALRRWWRDNWRWITTGLVLGVLGLLGFQYWQQRAAAKAEGAASAFRDLSTALTTGDRTKADALIQDLDKQYKGAPYVDHAHLQLAQSHIAAGKFEQAAAELKVVMEQSKDDALQKIARLRLARVQIQLGHHDEALNLLDAKESGAYAAQVHEVRGDALLAKGDVPSAQQAYRLALEAAKGGEASAALIQLKLQDAEALAPPPASAAVPAKPAG